MKIGTACQVPGHLRSGQWLFFLQGLKCCRNKEHSSRPSSPRLRPKLFVTQYSHPHHPPTTSSSHTSHPALSPFNLIWISHLLKEASRPTKASSYSFHQCFAASNTSSATCSFKCDRYPSLPPEQYSTTKQNKTKRTRTKSSIIRSQRRLPSTHYRYITAS